MDSQWLKIQFDLNPAKTKAGLAKAIGLEPPAISKILKGTRQIKAHEYVRMREYFELNLDAPMRPAFDGDGHYKQIPLDTKKQDGFEEMAGLVTAEEWTLPVSLLNKKAKSLPDQIRIFEIREETMEPDFSHGELVLVDLADRKPLTPGPYIVSDGFGYMVRFCELMPQSSPQEVRISANAQKFQTQVLSFEDFEILGRVVAKLQMLNLIPQTSYTNQKTRR